MMEQTKCVQAGSASVEGGAYQGREGLVLRRIGDEVLITGFYDGGCALDIELRLTIDELRLAAGLVAPQ